MSQGPEVSLLCACLFSLPLWWLLLGDRLKDSSQIILMADALPWAVPAENQLGGITDPQCLQPGVNEGTPAHHRV